MMPGMNRPRDNLFAVAFWVLLGATGVAVVQMAASRISLFSYDYHREPWPFSYMVAAALVGLAAFLGLANELMRRSRGADADAPAGANDGPTPAARLRAAAPLVVVVGIGVYQVAADGWSFLFIPLAMGAIGWTAGRLALLAGGAGAAAAAAADKPTTLGEQPAGSAPWSTFVICAAALAAGVWFTQLQRAHAAGHLGAPDVGLFANRLVNTWVGRHPFSDNTATPPFHDHFNPALYVLAPLAAIVNPLTLLNLVQCLALAAPALIWYRVARRAGHAPPSAALAAIAWLFVPSVSQLTYTMSYGFHPIALAAVAMAGSLAFAGQRRWIAFAVCAVIACAFRETLAISYAGVGLWLLAGKPTRRAGAIMTATSVSYFIAIVWLVLPAITGGQAYVGPSRFGHLGDSALGILLSPMFEPAAFFGTILSVESLLFAVTLFAGVAFLPVRTGRALLILLPEGILLLLWKDPNVRNIGYQYQTIIVVQLFWLAINTPQWLSTRSRRSPSVAAHHHAAAWMLFAAALIGSLLLGRWPVSTPNTPFDQELPRPYLADFMHLHHDLVAEGVAATPRAACYCVHSADLFVFPHDIPEDVRPPVFVLDWGDEWMRNDFTLSFPYLYGLQQHIEAAGYSLAQVQDEIAIFAKGAEFAAVGGGDIVLSELPADAVQCMPQPVTDELALVGWRFDEVMETAGQPYLVVECYLAVSATPPTDLGFSIRVHDPDWPMVPAGFSYVRPAGGFRMPSSTWPAGAIVRERATIPWLITDPIEPAQLAVTMRPYELATGRPSYPPR